MSSNVPNPPESSPTTPNDSGDLRPEEQTLVDIEKELNERLVALGLPLLTSGSAPAGRQTQVLTKSTGDGGGTTQVLDLRELRTALNQQIRIAEIKEQVIEVINDWLACMARTDGLVDPFEFELRAAALLIPYCREHIPDFPASLHPAELAMDLNFQPMLREELGRKNQTGPLTEDQIEDCAVQIIQSLLNHPLLPQKEADQIEISLQTTTLRDKNGTSVYTPSDGKFLKFLIEERQLLNRDGEIGLLAMLISGRKWNKIESEPLFVAAIEYTLEALARKRGIDQIIIRSQGPDHPVAYILREFILHNISLSLEEQMSFVEGFIGMTKNILDRPPEEFVEGIRREYVPRMKKIFHDLIHDSIHRFLQTFEREFLESKRSMRSKLFLLKRVGDCCELTFYCYEAVRSMESPSGEVYARERMCEGTEHFARRNNIPVSMGMDFFNRKNTLAELIVDALKYRREQQLRSHTGGLRSPDPEVVRTKWRQLSSVLMSDLLFCFDQMRRTFDHDYARGRESGYENYQSWKEMVVRWCDSYARFLFGRSLSDVDRYRIESLASQQIEEDLAFVNMHLPSVFRQGSQELGFEGAIRTRQPEDIIKENFLTFIKNFHSKLIGSDQQQLEQQAKFFETYRGRTGPTLTQEDLQKRVFLARSDLPLSTYTLEVLTSFLAPETHDRAVLLQALETGLELAQKAYIAEETRAVRVFLKQLQQRIGLLVILTEAERTNFDERLTLTIKELLGREPIGLASYILALKEIEDLRLSDERILEEWKNVETSIQRLQQIKVVLILTRRRAEIRDQVEAFSNWLSVTPISQESPRRRTFDARLQEIRQLVTQNQIQQSLLRLVLRIVRYVQIIASVQNWSPPAAYILEDMLTLETRPRRIRELEAILAVYPVDQLDELVHRFHTTLWERFQESSQSVAYYAPEEREVLTRRLERLQQLQARSDWQVTRARIGQSILSRLVKPFQKVLVAEEQV